MHEPGQTRGELIPWFSRRDTMPPVMCNRLVPLRCVTVDGTNNSRKDSAGTK